MKRKTILERIYFFIRIICLILILIGLYLIIIDHDNISKGKSIFNTVQLTIMFIVSFLPQFIEKRGNLEIPNFLEVIFLLFCICHFILGEIVNFYAKIRIWDSVLHIVSSAIFAILGVSVISLLNESKKIKVTTIFIFVFSICFSVTIGCLWEILEYLSDLIFKTNMQRFNNSITGKSLIGQDALKDTMKDLILDFLSAFTISIIALIDKRHNSNLFNRFEIAKKNSKNKKIDHNN